jgi:hypothetical protein
MSQTVSSVSTEQQRNVAPPVPLLISVAVAVVFCGFGPVQKLSAQTGPWTTSGPSIFYNSGNVGIGTTTPGDPLSVVGTGWSLSGTGVETAMFVQDTNNYRGVVLGFDTSGEIGVVAAASNGSASSLAFWTANGANWGERMRLGATGNLGIGTSNPCTNASAPPNCRLSVAGAIQAYAVVVNANWSDYVFAPDYHLRSLKETAAYIDQNHHLPDIPSEAEVKEKGVSLGDMQSKLLAKIEELTLQMIEAEQRSARLDQQNQALRERLEKQAWEFEARIARLEDGIKP